MKKLSAVLILFMAIQAHAIKATSSNAATVGGIAPANIVTTNTNQTISANKTVTSSFTFTADVQAQKINSNTLLNSGTSYFGGITTIGNTLRVKTTNSNDAIELYVGSTRVMDLAPYNNTTTFTGFKGGAEGFAFYDSQLGANSIEVSSSGLFHPTAMKTQTLNVTGNILTNGQVPTVGQYLRVFASSISWGN